MAYGELVLVPVPVDGHLHLTVTPERGFDMGAGKGKPVSRTVRGGVVGLVIDTRGRQPFSIPAEASARINKLRVWNRAMNMYPREV